ncbi:MAG TPA: sulfatase-like hydrolase/transferase, partial [Longimicrobiaceae bacterium]
MRRFIRLVASAAVLVGCAGVGRGEPAPGDATPPNIVMIVSDDHSWTDYGFMGHPEVRTPNLDRLARESFVYTRGYSTTALCRPSLATMITGLYPHEHGITGNDPPGGRPTMLDPAARAAMEAVFRRTETLPELLRRRNYVSLQTGKWWEGDPREHGFTAAMTHGDPTRGGRHGDEGLKIGREGMKPIFDFIASAGERPFFVWYAPLLPHTPHNPPQRLRDRYQAPGRAPEVASYYAMVEWLDETVGELLTHLDDNGLRENTVVLYVADNGWVQATGGGSIFETRSKMSPYDAGTRTPIMIRWPGRVEPGRDDESLASTL